MKTKQCPLCRNELTIKEIIVHLVYGKIKFKVHKDCAERLKLAEFHTSPKKIGMRFHKD